MRSRRMIFLWLTVALFVSAQDSTGVSVQDAIESIVDEAADEQDLQQFVEELEYFRQNPINLLRPNYNELIKLPFISPLLAEAIILYTDTVQITSADQLMNVPLITKEVYERLLPFVTVEEPAEQSLSSSYMPNQVESRSRYERRLQPAKGFADGSFRGEAYSTYQRLRIGNENMDAAGLFEKDAGELFQDGMVAGFISLKNISSVSQIVAGHYTISSGQGLVVAKNLSTSKGSNAIGQIRKRGSTISPSVSTDEYRYFQGAATEVQFNGLSVVGFYSDRKLPASIDSAGFATSFYTSGIYRTENDLARRNTLNEKVTGGRIEYSFEKARTISATAVRIEYDKYLKQALLDLRDRREILAGSLSWDMLFSSLNFFGEAASNNGTSYSKILGVSVPVTKEFSVSYHHRAFTKGFVSPLARPFGERENISDGELGNYFGSAMRLKEVTINSYIDIYSLPATEPGFGATATEIYSHVAYSGIKNVDLMFHVRDRTKSQIAMRELDDQRTQINYRAAYKFQIDRFFSLAQRFEVVNVSYNPSHYREKGFLTFVEGAFKGRTIGLSTKARIVFFDSDSYDSRLYQYESDVAGNFSNPPLYGRGMRWYVVAGYEIFNDFQLSLKYSETKKLNEAVLGSGDDEITGNFDNYLAIQLDYQL